MSDGPKRVAWTVLLRVGDEGAATKLLFRLQECLGGDVELGDVVRYWKDESLYSCTFDTPLPTDSGFEVVSAVLEMAGALAPSWEVSGLTEPAATLEGVAVRGFAVSGVTWASFSLTS